MPPHVPAPVLQERLQDRGYLILATSGTQFRIVTHREIDDNAVDGLLAAWRQVAYGDEHAKESHG